MRLCGFYSFETKEGYLLLASKFTNYGTIVNWLLSSTRFSKQSWGSSWRDEFSIRLGGRTHGQIDRVKRFVNRNDQRETEGPDHERRGAMYDRQSRQPITLQYLITRTRSSRGGPRSLSMDTDHSIRFSIISISLRDILPVDRLNQPSPITDPYLRGSLEYYFTVARVTFDNNPPSFLPSFLLSFL